MCIARVSLFARRLPPVLLSALLCWVLSSFAHAAIPAVATQNNDNARTGANLNETILTPANVNATKFGKLSTITLDANVNGQALYVPGVTINNVLHNVLYVYTSNNTNNSPCSLYAFDADSYTQLWRHQFTNGAQWTQCAPVIDTVNSLIYVLTKDTNDSGATRLHAFDLTSDVERPGSPITIAATVAGTGDGSSNGKVSFDTSHANCRPGLLLLNGVVYCAFAHNTDSFPYHGWVFGYKYDGATFTQTAVFNTAPNGGEDGIWQSGKGLTADASGNIYCAVGNGTFSANSGGDSYGMCYLKLSTPNLTVADWFAPYDQQTQSDKDYDLGNTGLVGIPGTTRLFAGATKFGSAFLLDSTNMGGFTANGPDKAVQRLDNTSNTDNVGQNPIAWDAGTTKYVYLWPRGYELQQFKYDTTLNKLSPAGVWKKTSSVSAGGSLAISANGGSNGILWAVGSNSVFHAFNASNLSLTELWNSSQSGARDKLDSVGHFQFPTVVNGKAYVPTGSSTIDVYGLLPTATSATFVKTDATAQGTWKGLYGSDGYNIINNDVSYPIYVTIDTGNPSSWTWNASTSELPALQKAGTATDRIAACWYGSSYTIDVYLTDGNTHQISLYNLDYLNLARTQTIDVLDASTNAVLDSQNVSSFSGGKYLIWNIKGHVKFRVTNTGPYNAVISGLFFDPTGGTVPASATFVKTDSTTQGSWKGAYGTAGYNVINNSISYPTYANVSGIGNYSWTWNSSTSEIQALQKAGTATDRIAACWYNASVFTVDVNLTDGNTHQVSLYNLDYSVSGRTQTIDVLDAGTSAVLDTQTLSSFSGGKYLVWNIKGHVKFRVTNTGPYNSVISGLFFD